MEATAFTDTNNSVRCAAVKSGLNTNEFQSLGGLRDVRSDSLPLQKSDDVETTCDRGHGTQRKPIGGEIN